MLRLVLDLDTATTAKQLGIAPGTVRAHCPGDGGAASSTCPPTTLWRRHNARRRTEPRQHGDDALRAMRQALSDVPAPGASPLEVIAAKAQAVRRRRRSSLAAAGSAATAVAITVPRCWWRRGTRHPRAWATGRCMSTWPAFPSTATPTGRWRLEPKRQTGFGRPSADRCPGPGGLPAVVRVGAFCGRPSRRPACIRPSSMSSPATQVASHRLASARAAASIRPSAMPRTPS